MRYVLAMIFVCAVGIDATSALPTTSARTVSVVTTAPIVQVAKRNRSAAHRQNNSANGIHPLVGSGDY